MSCSMKKTDCLTRARVWQIKPERLSLKRSSVEDEESSEPKAESVVNSSILSKLFNISFVFADVDGRLADGTLSEADEIGFMDIS